MAVQKKTPTKKTKASTAAVVKNSSAKSKSTKKPSTRDTLKKATFAKKSSSSSSVTKKSTSGSVINAKSLTTRKSVRSETKAGDKIPAVTKKSPAKKNIPVAKAPAKNISPKQKNIKQSAAEKKAAEKTTVELLEAIKARDVETHPVDAPAKESEVSEESPPTKSTARAKANKKPTLLPIVPPMQKAVEIVAASAKEKKKRNRSSFTKKELNLFQSELMAMRDRFVDQTFAMKHDALRRDDEVNSEEDGTDAFMRLQALSQMNDQQHIVADIDVALSSIEDGSYGACEMCDCLISRQRLQARPFAKFCIKCKSEMERAIRFNKPR